jgi:alkylhydroperoxidase/carboxymuconolactone decarboxylase family protein YurZ
VVAGVEGTAAPRARPPASHAHADDVRPLDDTAESAPDTATSLMDTLSRRAIVMLVAQQTQQQKLQAHLDRIKAHFNATQEERAEMMRQMNVLRDMALEQAKKDDEVLKKYIAMI